MSENEGPDSPSEQDEALSAAEQVVDVREGVAEGTGPTRLDT